MTRAMRQYLNWLNRNEPELYAAVYRAMADRGPGLGAPEPQTLTQDEGTWVDDLTGFITDLAPVYVATEQQKQLNKLNLERARMGQAPLDASQASTISTQVGLSPQTQQTMLLGAGILTIGAITAVALARPRRRR